MIEMLKNVQTGFGGAVTSLIKLDWVFTSENLIGISLPTSGNDSDEGIKPVGLDSASYCCRASYNFSGQLEIGCQSFLQ